MWVDKFKSFIAPKYRLLFYGSTACWVIFLILYITDGVQNYQSQVKKGFETVEQSNLLVEDYLDNTFRILDIILRDTIRNIEKLKQHKKLSTLDYNRILAERSEYFPEFLGIRVTDKLGNIIGIESGESVKVNLSDRPYFQEHKKNPNSGLIISKPVMGRISREMVVVTSRQIKNKLGQFNGVVFAPIRIDYFLNYLKKFNMGSNGSISIFSVDDYTLFARNPPLSQVGKKIKNSEVYSNILAGKSEGFVNSRSANDGIKRLHYFKVNQNTNLVVVAGVAIKDFLMNWIQNNLIAWAFLFLTSGVYFYVLIRHIKNVDIANE